MKKIAMLLAIVLLVATPLTVQAATPRLINISPELSFTGTTANCTVRVFADYTTQEIEATITLWHGNSWIERWEVSADGYFSWHDTVPVTSGNTYRLSVDVSIDGEDLDQVYISKTCP